VTFFPSFLIFDNISFAPGPVEGLGDYSMISPCVETQGFLSLELFSLSCGSRPAVSPLPLCLEIRAGRNFPPSPEDLPISFCSSVVEIPRIFAIFPPFPSRVVLPFLKFLSPTFRFLARMAPPSAAFCRSETFPTLQSGPLVCWGSH